MSEKQVFGSKCYIYSSDDIIPSPRHAIYYDLSGKYVLKIMSDNSEETINKIDYMINFRRSFEIANPTYSFLVASFPFESIYRCEKRDKSEWTGFVMKRCSDKSLEEVGIRTRGFKEYFQTDSYVAFLSVCANLCTCCQLLHRQKILLSDIKPNNFFVTKQGGVYPIDPDGFSHKGGSSQPPLPFYCPDEINHSKEIPYIQTVETESYSLTILLLQMLTGITFVGKTNLAELRSYDLQGIGEYRDAVKGVHQDKMKGAKKLFYQRWFMMPPTFRDVFIDAIYNRCYRIPTATGWYNMITDYITKLNDEGYNPKIVPESPPLLGPEYNSTDYIENVSVVSRIWHISRSPCSKELTESKKDTANQNQNNGNRAFDFNAISKLQCVLAEKENLETTIQSLKAQIDQQNEAYVESERLLAKKEEQRSNLKRTVALLSVLLIIAIIIIIFLNQ